MERRYLQLNDIDSYKIAFNLANYVWNIVIRWDIFAKKTLGDQFVRAVDSISVLIAEGFGRYHKKDKIHYYRMSLGSLKESLDCNEKAKVRNLLTEEEYGHVLQELKRLPKEINHMINFTNEKLTD